MSLWKRQLLVTAAFIIGLFVFASPASARLFEPVTMSEGHAVMPDAKHVFRVLGDAWIVPGRLLKPKELEESKVEPRLVRFPESWRRIDDPSIPMKGVATYLFTLHFPESSIGELWGIWMPRHLGAMRIWINGQAIVERGRVTADPQRIRYETGNVRHYFVLRGPKVDMVVQTANYHLHSGGFRSSFFVGPEQALRRFTFGLNMLDGAIAGSLVFSALYHLWLYTFRQKWRWYLLLGVFFVAVTLRLTLVGLSRWGLDFGWPEIFTWKIEYTTFYLMVPLGSITLSWAFPKESFPRFNQIIYFFSTAAVLWVAVTPQWLAYYSLRPMQVLVLVTFCLSLYTMGMAIWHKREGARMIALSVLVLYTAGGIDILHSIDRIDTTFSILGPASLLLAIVSSFFQATSFEKTYRQVEHQIRDITQLKGDLEQQAIILEERVQRKTEDLQAVLQNTEESILILTQGGQGIDVSPLASQAAYQLFGVSTLTWSAVESLLLRTQLTADQYAQCQAALHSMIGGSELDFEFNSWCLPLELCILDGQEIRSIVTCRWIPLEKAGQVTEVLLILLDVTAERKEAQRAALARASTERLMHIIALNPKNFLTFVHEAEHLIERSRVALKQTEVEPWHLLLREVHTLKGLARHFGMLHLASDVHEGENQLIQIRTSPHGQEHAARVLDHLELSLGCYKDEARAVGYLKEHELKLSHELTREIFLLAQELRRMHPKPPEIWQKQWKSFLTQAFNTPEELINVLQNGLIHLAGDLKKPVPEVRREGPPVWMTQEQSESLLGALTHLFRNALDHGIEAPQVRAAQGKSPIGCITVRWWLSPHFRWQIFDDGQGLNLNRILERGIDRGLVVTKAQLSDEAIAELVFAPDFSTKDHISGVSGRGVGMDAVRATLAELGGAIRIRWMGEKRADGCRPCCWDILLPRSIALEEAA